MLCAQLSPELELVETHEVGLSMTSLKEQQGTVKRLRTGKGAESKPQVVQCVREGHREPDEEQSTNSRPEVTLLFQF